jgi:hypothetical protein
MRRFATTTLGILAALAALVALDRAALGQTPSYRLERIASGLSQPVYMSQAPGDPANIIYYMTRVTTGGGGASSGTHGSLWRYDMSTRQSTEVLNLSHRNLTLDLGPQGFTFHPDFNEPTQPGYQKVFVSSAATGGPLNYVEEYALSGPGGTVPKDGSNLPIVNRTLLQYTNVFGDNNHVIDWIGFDPRAYSAPVGSPERNYLFISAGDGSNGQNATNRPEQKSNIEQGKLLRIDVDPSKPDFYPADPLRNYAIPATNPIPLWNSTHGPNEQLVGTRLNYVSPTQTVSYTPALPELYFTGTRNTFRMSMDKLTGDFWSGDVGEVDREEINFLPADPYDGSQVPYDFGFPQREGTNVEISRAAGNTFITWNLSGGGTVQANSVNPVQEGPHATFNSGSTSGTAEIRSTSRSAYIGGYMYRGPITELQGKYFYSDFVQGNIMMLDFNTDTPVASFSGNNLNRITVQTGIQAASLGTEQVVLNRNLNSLWHTLLVDPADPSYTPALGSQYGVGRVVSFGEDNAGNLYIIDMGGARGDAGFGNDYPSAATGEIFRLTKVLSLKLTVDRDTGSLTLVNETGAPFDIRGYTIASTAGALDSATFNPITGNFDAPPSGDGSIDPNNPWQITSPGGSAMTFAESTTGDGGTLPVGGTLALSAAGGWIRSAIEDVSFTLTLGDGTFALGSVEYVGAEINTIDLNADGNVDVGDWVQFIADHRESLAGRTPLQQFLAGDIDRDGDNDFDDFEDFKLMFEAINGPGSLAEAIAEIPEPNAVGLALAAAAAIAHRRRRAA